MPKQSGVHILRGKLNNECYYTMKGHPGGFVRRINQNMSQRVKTEPGFEQTRKYASEFGYAGALASKSFYAVPGITYDLHRKSAQGELTKYILGDLTNHSQGEFGKRFLRGLDWQQPLIDKINSLSKIKMDDAYPMRVTTTYKETADPMYYSGEFHIEFTDRMGDFMRINGIDMLKVTIAHVSCSGGLYAEGEGTYKYIGSTITPETASDLVYRVMASSAHDIYLELKNCIPYPPQDYTFSQRRPWAGYSRPILVVQAFKHIGAQDVELQRFAAFKILDQGTLVGGEIIA